MLNNLNPVCCIPVLGMSRAEKEPWKDLGSVIVIPHGHFHWCGRIVIQKAGVSVLCLFSVSVLITGWLVGKSGIQDSASFFFF